MKVLISDSMSEKAVEIFKKTKGIDVDVITGLKPEELKKIIGAYDGIAIRSATKMTPDVIEAATNLKVIGRAGTGDDAPFGNGLDWFDRCRKEKKLVIDLHL